MLTNLLVLGGPVQIQSGSLLGGQELYIRKEKNFLDFLKYLMAT